MQSFKLLGVEERSSQATVLRAWHRLALKHYTDKTGIENDSLMQELNKAKDQCMKHIIERDYEVSEQKFTSHICRVVEPKLLNDLD